MVSCTLAFVLFRLATSTRPSPKLSELAANYGEANSVPDTPMLTYTTRMATKLKSGTSETAALGFRADSGWTVVVSVVSRS